MRIECGNGQIAVHDGTLDGVPCLSIGNNGTGVIGDKVEGGEMPEEIEILNVTFLNKESVEVWIKHLTLVKDMIISADNYEQEKAQQEAALIYAQDRYFNARPKLLRTVEVERLFQAGFEMAYRNE